MDRDSLRRAAYDNAIFSRNRRLCYNCDRISEETLGSSASETSPSYEQHQQPEKENHNLLALALLQKPDAEAEDSSKKIHSSLTKFKETYKESYDEFLKMSSVLLAIRDIPSCTKVEEYLYIRLIRCLAKHIQLDFLNELKESKLLPNQYCSFEITRRGLYLNLKGKLKFIEIQRAEIPSEKVKSNKLMKQKNVNESEQETDAFLVKMLDFLSNCGDENKLASLLEYSKQFVDAASKLKNAPKAEAGAELELEIFHDQLKAYLRMAGLLQNDIKMLEEFLEKYPLPNPPIKALSAGLSLCTLEQID